MSDLTIIAKVTDQCNLWCPYCYYYSGGAASLRARKIKNRSERLADLARAIVQSRTIRSFDSVNVVLHGGEPLLVPASEIEDFLDAIRLGLPQARFSCQTNGSLIDESWVELFIRHRVHVGVSIDAIAKYHDERRPKSRGRGSFEECVSGFQLINSGRYQSELGQPGIISVYDSRVTPDQYLAFFVEQVGTKNFEILLPDEAFESPNSYNQIVPRYNRFLVDFWERYLELDDPSINFKFFSTLFRANKQSLIGSRGETSPSGFVVVDLEGDVFFEDGLRYAFDTNGLKIGNWQQESFCDLLMKAELQWRSITVPMGQCTGCSHRTQCGGGPLGYRYSPTTNAFDQYALCSATKVILDDIMELR